MVARVAALPCGTSPSPVVLAAWLLLPLATPSTWQGSGTLTIVRAGRRAAPARGDCGYALAMVNGRDRGLIATIAVVCVSLAVGILIYHLGWLPSGARCCNSRVGLVRQSI